MPSIDGHPRHKNPENTDPGMDYEKHFHAAASGYLVLTTDGTILDVNQTLASWTGRSRDGLLGGNILDLMPRADQVLFSSYAVPQLAVSGCFNEMAADLVSADGECVPVLLSGVRSEDGGNGAEIDRIAVFNASERRLYEQDLVAALRKAEAAEAARAAAEEEIRQKQKALEEKDRILQANLLESREREALLESVLDAADVGLLVVDPKGNTLLTNTHLLSSWRRVMGDIPITAKEQTMFGPDRVTPIGDADNPARRAAAGEAFSDQLVWFGAGEHEMALNVSARPIKGEGSFSGSVIAFSDVSRLVRAVAAQEEFVASVSHELRTPLTSIMGYLDLALDEEGLSPQVKSAIEIALRNSERLLALVSDLLSVASGATKMDRRPMNLAEIVRAGVVSAAPKAAASRVALVTDIPESLIADVDPQRLAQVVDNLLSNAVKYSPGGGTVTVRLWQDAEAVRLCVADTGIGMSEAEQEKVFTKFFRARRAIASAIPGVGLGLVITRNIVAAHGGELSFVSSPGEGSEFTVSLPGVETAGGISPAR
ncbi:MULTISPECIES: ATP-binding protein [unclassified Arthrobacter]|uniref:ATP-binding protein n=1 Tax=unclassified Arthrobacter TaxID=235627 RepID=UPI0024DF8EFB|nr:MULTISPECIES: ATP-binding protein [unclassified Arthrobacter]MCC9144452.1 PAS domain S-box protein [Arthrobacter sp. zg-Y919]MDK1275678.1 PAS domain-containing sensor histidine kinase [Arthrobacter sp. zg.Y919]WIB02954.1 PAS domain-containing sensor histidine kinase [Arthrobacter sp. zg-Y919]